MTTQLGVERLERRELLSAVVESGGAAAGVGLDAAGLFESGLYSPVSPARPIALATIENGQTQSEPATDGALIRPIPDDAGGPPAAPDLTPPEPDVNTHKGVLVESDLALVVEPVSPSDATLQLLGDPPFAVPPDRNGLPARDFAESLAARGIALREASFDDLPPLAGIPLEDMPTVLVPFDPADISGPFAPQALALFAESDSPAGGVATPIPDSAGKELAAPDLGGTELQSAARSAVLVESDLSFVEADGDIEAAAVDVVLQDPGLLAWGTNRARVEMPRPLHAARPAFVPELHVEAQPAERPAVQPPVENSPVQPAAAVATKKSEAGGAAFGDLEQRLDSELQLLVPPHGLRRAGKN